MSSKPILQPALKIVAAFWMRFWKRRLAKFLETVSTASHWLARISSSFFLPPLSRLAESPNPANRHGA